MIQWGNKSLEYPSCEPCAATVKPDKRVFALEVDGMFGGVRLIKWGVGSAATMATEAMMITKDFMFSAASAEQSS